MTHESPFPNHMSVKDFVSTHSTPDKGILLENDNLQLACFFDLSEEGSIVQDCRYLSAGFEPKDGFSIRPFSIDAVKSCEQAHALFRREETEAFWICVYRDIEKSTRGIATLIGFLGESWSAILVVVLEAEKGPLLEHSRDSAKQFRLDSSTVMVRNDAVVSNSRLS